MIVRTQRKQDQLVSPDAVADAAAMLETVDSRHASVLASPWEKHQGLYLMAVSLIEAAVDSPPPVPQMISSFELDLETAAAAEHPPAQQLSSRKHTH